MRITWRLAVFTIYMHSPYTCIHIYVHNSQVPPKFTTITRWHALVFFLFLNTVRLCERKRVLESHATVRSVAWPEAASVCESREKTAILHVMFESPPRIFPLSHTTPELAARIGAIVYKSLQSASTASSQALSLCPRCHLSRPFRFQSVLSGNGQPSQSRVWTLSIHVGAVKEKAKHLGVVTETRVSMLRRL